MTDIEAKPKGIAALRIDPKIKTGGGSRRKGIYWISLAIVAAVTISVFAITQTRRVTVEVATARSAGLSEATAVLNASGYVTPRRRATIAAKITGRIKEMLVEEGMKVQKGQVLARLDDADARANYEAAKAERAVALAAIPELEVNLKDAERTLKRAQALEQEGVIDTQTMEKTQANVDALKARLALAHDQVKVVQARMKVARLEIKNCVIQAPFSGIAISKDAQVGEIVSPLSAGGGFTRTGISTIVDMESIEIEVDVNESYIARVLIGQKVQAALDAYPDWHIPTKVRAIIPAADRQKATVKVRIAFDNLDPKILPDMGVKVTFLSEESAQGQGLAKALIPQEAIREIDGKPTVFILKGKRLEQRRITKGNSVGNDVEILAGVIPGEQIVTSGPKVLKDGQKVRINE